MSDDRYVRHTLPMVFDVPATLAEQDSEQVTDALNIITARLFDLIGDDLALQQLFARYGIEWGWGSATWEA